MLPHMNMHAIGLHSCEPYDLFEELAPESVMSGAQTANGAPDFLELQNGYGLNHLGGKLKQHKL
jgi:hypothetical protein